jgi:hypothetical protein
MPVTVMSDDIYRIIVDNATPGSGDLVVAKRSTPTEVWRLEQTGRMVVTGRVESPNAVVFNNRAAGSAVYVMRFVDDTGTAVAAVDYWGRWVCTGASKGMVIPVTSACSGSATSGATKALSDTATPAYGIVGNVGGTWRKVALT